MTKYYLVYVGLQRYRDGSERKRVRVKRLGNFKTRPKIIDIDFDPASRRAIVTIQYTKRMPSARIKGTTYRRGGKLIRRKGYTRGGYTVTKERQVVLGDVANKSSIRITTKPPKGPLMDFK